MPRRARVFRLVVPIVCALTPILARELTIDERVEAQRAIEQVFWSHRIWPAENPSPKPLLSEVISDTELRARVDETLRQSNSLATRWNRDDGIAAPSFVSGVTASRSGTDIVVSWSAVAGASSYDTVKGGLTALRSGGGGFLDRHDRMHRRQPRGVVGARRGGPGRGRRPLPWPALDVSRTIGETIPPDLEIDA